MLPLRLQSPCLVCPGRLLGLLVMLVAMLVAGPAIALDPFKPIHRYAHATWDRDNGLPSTSVQALLQTRDGYLWFGTQDGLVRFDGHEFEVFDSRSTPAIANNHVQALLETRDGTLWFSTLGGGLVRYRDESFEALTTEHGLSSVNVRSLVEDDDGVLWVGTELGLDRLRDGRFETWDLREALGDSTIKALHVDQRGRLWVASRDGGACVFVDGACTEPELPAGVRLERVRDFLEAKDGSFWIGTEGHGLFRIRGEEVTHYTTQEGLLCTDVTTLLEDMDGNLWIGTRRSGLNRIGPGGPEVYGEEQGLSFSHITSLLEDREGSLWVGTYAGGVNRFREASFITYGVRDGIATEVVLGVLEDRLGYVWLGTMEGLYRMHGEEVVPFPGMEFVDRIAVLAMYQDDSGALWVGTFGQGLFRYVDGEWTRWTIDEGLPANYVFALAQDVEGVLWVGTQSGLMQFVDGAPADVDMDEEFAHQTVRMLHLDGQGRLWVGFDGQGLCLVVDGELVPQVLPEDSHPSLRKVVTATESADGTLWFGTEGGLLRLREGVLGVLTSEHGLWDDRIWRVLEDDAGNLWCASNRGVFRMEKREIDAFFMGQLEKVGSQVFGTADGMASAECNGGYTSAGTRSEDGRLWFPTTRGVSAVDPAEALRPKPIPPMVIRSVVVDNQRVDHRQPIVLEAGVFRVDFEYTAPSFIAPDKVQYRHRLDHGPWSPTSDDRRTTFTNLPHGEHSFQVIASNGYGAWNERGVTVSFTVEPHYYETTWFYLLVGLGLLLLVIGGYWAREQQHLARERVLEDKVAARTKELEELALRDALTHLRNRRFLYETVRPLVAAISRQYSNPHAADRAERKTTIANHISLAIIDIDHFKSINDTHGHDAGDVVLQQFSRLLEDTARGQDFVARWGGEEFLAVLLGADREGLEAFGERFRRRVAAREFSLPAGGSTRITCSAGLVCCPFYPAGELGLDLEQMITVADLGLYHAKRSGRDRCMLVKPGIRPPTSRDEAIRAFASFEEATEGGYLEVEQITLE